MRLVCLALTWTFMAAGCASLESTVRTRAAQDFRCSEDQLRILDREQTVFRIAGCGEVATYECTESRALAVSCRRAAWEPPLSQPRAASPDARSSVSRY
jgi:predicted RNA-binding Zn-ribbon protein involved in translation (DUF1610 family)